MTDYNFRELEFIDKTNSHISFLSNKIAEIEKHLKRKELSKSKEIGIEDFEFVEINDPETENLFQSLIEIEEFIKNGFFYNSLFTSIYSFFEYTLINYCLYLNKKNKIGYNNFNSNSYIYFEDCINFLKEKYKIKFGQNKEYNTICKYKRIRDMIIHNQSMLNNDKNISLKRLKGIHISKNNLICIKDAKILYDSLNIVNKFLTTIIKNTKHF